MKKKRILIISGEFIPYTQSIGGVIRVLSFLKSLKKNNLKLISLKKNYYGYFGFRSYIKNVKKKYLENKLSKPNKIKHLFISIIRFYFSNLLYILGIDQNFFSKKIYLREIKSSLKNFKPDFILISGPPFSLFKLVNEIRSLNQKVKIILDYRDGWSSRIRSKKFYLIKKIMNNAERKILDKCNFVLCATSQIYKDVKSLKKKNIYLIKNGFLKNEKKIVSVSKSDRKILIGYFGLISDSSYGYRDIKVIYNSLKSNNKIQFSFYGNSIIKNKNIKNSKYFKFYKNISYFETQNKMKQFDYLLILHTEKSTSKEVVTGKFYEYLSSQTPIIMISNGETEAGKIIKKNKLGFSVDYSRISLEKFFSNLKKIKRNNIKSSYMKKFSRLEQNKKLVKIINEN